MSKEIKLLVLREGLPPVCSTAPKENITFDDLFTAYPFPAITEEKRKRVKDIMPIPLLFVNEHTFVGAPDVDSFISANKPIEEFVSGKSLVVQMRYRVPLFYRPAFYGKAVLSPSGHEHISLTEELGVPESYWDEFFD